MEKQVEQAVKGQMELYKKFHQKIKLVFQYAPRFIQPRSPLHVLFLQFFAI
jgi:hypothetical protein